MRLSGTKSAAIHQYRGLGNQLWDLAGNRPSLDLPFADSKSLVDATTGARLVDFTRASSGTYVDSEGVIRTATTNLLLRSEEFQTTWTRTGILGFGSGSAENAVAAPNGTITADLITEDTATSTHRIQQGSLTTVAGTYTVSVYAKQASGSRNLRLNFNVVAGASAVFNITNGTVASVIAGSASISPVGDGWYRCSVTGASAGGTSTGFIQLENNLTESYTGDGTSGIYLWGAQLEQSSTVGEYVPTTSTINSAPRFDHDPETGESLGLLVEESRTNLLLRSEGFGTTWTANNTTVTADAITAPDGFVTADLMVEDSLLAEHNRFQSISVAASTAYTISIYAKANTRSKLVIRANITGGYLNCGYDLALGTVTRSAAGYTCSIQALPNGWYRCIATATSSTATSRVIGIGMLLNDLTGDSAPAYQGDGASGLYVWGAQLEAGSFPTSYIPTTTAAATRSADVASISGSNFSSWYRQDEGTVFAEILPRQFSQAFGVLSIDDGTTSERLQTRFSTAGSAAFVVADGGSVQANFATSNSATLNTKNKLATSFALNDFAACLAGGAVALDASGTLPTPAQAVIGNAVGAFYLNAPISRITFWPARLPNSTLQTITQ